jgi:hypothetical protein
LTHNLGNSDVIDLIVPALDSPVATSDFSLSNGRIADEASVPGTCSLVFRSGRTSRWR